MLMYKCKGYLKILRAVLMVIGMWCMGRNRARRTVNPVAFMPRLLAPVSSLWIQIIAPDPSGALDTFEN
jgi:hypothetical protein